MDPQKPTTDFVATDGKLITRTGKYGLPAGEGIDLNGKTLMPAFFDTHMHLLGYGSELTAVNLRGAASIAELVERVRVRVEQEPADSWIFGRGWDENFYAGVLPSRADLDKVAPEHPVLLFRICGHLLVCNSRALQVLKIDETTPVPEGGAMDRDAAGQLTGIFRENAMGLVTSKLPHRTDEDLAHALTLAGESVLSLGITTVHTDDLGGVHDIKSRFELYRGLFLAGKLPKVHLHIHSEQLDEAVALGWKTGTKLDGITVGGVKIFADGSLGARTAAMLEDYSDCLGEKGILIYSDEDLYKMVKAAHSADFTVALHAIGDAAGAQVMRIIGRVQDEDPKPQLRHRMIHAQILNPEIIDAMARYRVIGEIQPIFINTDLHWAERRVGERIRTSYNWQSLWQRGIRLTGSSDCPVEPVNPLYGIYSAVTRKDLKGRPAGGWYPEEALALEQALALYTTCGAYTGREESEAGLIAAGKTADLIVLDRPIDGVPAEEIKDLKVLMTVMDGKVMYDNL